MRQPGAYADRLPRHPVFANRYSETIQAVVKPLFWYITDDLRRVRSRSTVRRGSSNYRLNGKSGGWEAATPGRAALEPTGSRGPSAWVAESTDH